MSEYIPKYPSEEGDDSNKTSSELLAETLKPIYVPQDLMLAWESHLASYSRDTHELLDQVKDSEEALNTQYQALLARVQKYEQMLQDITMDSNEFTMDSDVENFTGWNILAQASYWDYLLRKEITKLSDQIKSSEYKGALVTEVTDTVLEGLIADNNYISNVIEALSNTPLIQELDAALNSTTSSLTELQAEYVRLAEKQVADAEALANQLVEKAEQSAASLEAAIAEQLDRIADEAATRTRLLQELEDKTDAMTAEYNEVADALHTTVIQELTTLQDGITTSVSELKSADEAIITNLDAYKVSNGENIAALQSNINVVSNAQESTASQVTGLVASYDQLGLGLSKAQADIVTSNKARADGDEALSQQITTINAGLGDANSRIDTVSDAVSSLDSATATKFTQLDTRLGGVDDSIASVRQIANSAVDTNTAQATEINTLNSRMSTTEGDVTKKADASALSNLETKVDNADTAISARIDALVANLTTPEGTEINANAFNALRAEVTNNSGNIATHTSQITALNSSLSNVNTGISANADAVADLRTTVTQQGDSITSHAQSIQQLKNDLDVAEAGLATKASTTALNTTNTNVTNLDGRVTTESNRITSLTGRVDTVEGGLTTKADVSAVNALTTRVGDVEGGVSTQAADITALKSSLGLYVLPTDKDTSQQNKWARITLRKTQPYISINVVPDYSYIGTYPEHSQGYFAEGATTTLPIDNSINYYRTLINVAAASTINLGNLMGDDAHAIYVDGKGVYSKTGYSTNACSFAVTAGEHVVDIVVNNGTGGAGFSSTITMSSQVSSMYAPKLTGVLIGNKAEASAIQTTNTEVSRIDRVVVAQGASITNLQAGLTTANNNIATKADGSALSALTTRVSNAEGGLSSQSSKVTKLEAGVGNTSTYVVSTSRNGSFRAGGLPWGLYNTTLTRLAAFSRGFNLVVWAADGSYSSVQIFDTYASSANVASLATALLALPVNIYFTLVGADNIGTASALQGNVELKNFIIANGGSASYYSTWGDNNLPIFTSMVGTGTGTGIQHSFNSNIQNDWIKYPISLISGIPEGFAGVQPIDESKFATASALSTLDTKVVVIDGRVSSQASQLVTLKSSKSAIENGAIAGNDEYVVDLRDPAYNRDLYYPVLLSGFSSEYRQTIRVMSTLNGVSVPPWSSHGGGFSLNAQFQMGGAEWGVIDPEIVTDNFSYSWTHGSVSPLDQIGQIGASSQPFFYVRGGGYYKLSKPVNRSVQVCAPNGSLSGYYEGVLYPRPYQASTVPKSINQGLNQQNVKLQQTNEVVSGVKAISTVTVDNNGVMSGYGLISELVNGQVTSAFGVNANTFFVGAPSGGKKPFIVTSYPQTIDGVTYPAGTYINTALIANATIGTAHIADAAITNAKIANLDAAKITSGYINSDRIEAGSISVKKLAVQDNTNLWGNRYLSSNSFTVDNAPFSPNPGYIGNAIFCERRDHIGEWASRYPVRKGDVIVTEFTARAYKGSGRDLNAGILCNRADGTITELIYPAPQWLGTVSGAWNRYRTVVTVNNDQTTHARLFFQIEQNSSGGAYGYDVCDIVQRRALGGELLVDGAITADKISVNELSAISGNLGTLVTTGPNGTTTITGSYTEVKDASGKIRVKMGVW